MIWNDKSFRTSSNENAESSAGAPPPASSLVSHSEGVTCFWFGVGGFAGEVKSLQCVRV